MFKDRIEAGQALARQLLKRNFERPVVLALPRGGVPVAFEVARALSAPLDLILVRKIGHPFQSELALGAIVDGDQPDFVLNEDVAAVTDDLSGYLEEAKVGALAEIERRRKVYLGGRSQVEVQDCSAIVVDDGIATGATVRAALKALRNKHPKRIVLAVPVAPRDTIDNLQREVDEIVCLEMPDPFCAIGLFYKDFRPIDDAEVIRLLRAADPPTAKPPCRR
jgi:putative phosphoribosyl transferase